MRRRYEVMKTTLSHSIYKYYHKNYFPICIRRLPLSYDIFTHQIPMFVKNTLMEQII